MDEPGDDTALAGISLWERLLLALVVVALVATRLLAYSEAGALWRDEVHSVDMATAPDILSTWTSDSFPVVWQLVLRGWIALFGSGDGALRLLGLTIGMAVIPAMFWMARQFGVAIPWWLLVFLGLDPSLIVFGGEVRGYGLGVLTLLLLIGTAWSTVQRPSAWKWAGLTVAALLAVQASFTNCFLLAGAFVGCGAVALRRKEHRVWAAFLAVGIMAAASMLPYALYVFPKAELLRTLQSSIPWHILATICGDAFTRGGIVRVLAWLAVGLAALTEIARRLFSRREPESERRDDVDLPLFLATFIVVGSAGFWWYMKFLGVMTQVWYYLPWLTLLAVAADLGAGRFAERLSARRLLLAAGATAVGLLMLVSVIPAVRYRLTNVDLVAARLSREARAGDLIVVFPWYVGISFNRYYFGPAEWMNYPNVDRDRQHAGYRDLKQEVMIHSTPKGVEKELDQFRGVLQAGARVWWVGEFRFLPPGSLPLRLEGAPDPRYGWSEGAYQESWLQFAALQIQTSATSVRRLDVPMSCQVNPYENPPIFVFQRAAAESPP